MKRRKAIIAALILGAAGVSTHYAVQKYNEPKLSGLALANAEALAADEYEIGWPLTNWKEYRVQCTRTIGFDSVLTYTVTTTYWADVCGSGSGWCLAPAGC